MKKLPSAKKLSVVNPDIAIQKGVGTQSSDGHTLKNLWLELPNLTG